MAFKGVIFDLDGTLVHSLPEYRYRVVGATLKNLGRTASEADIDRFWFESRRDELVKERFNLEPPIFWKEYRAHDDQDLRRELTKPYDDINFLDELKARGYKLGIVTGAPLHIASLEIEMIGEDKFDAIVIAHTKNGRKPKPHPDGLNECLDLLGIGKNDAPYVGNADEDVLTANNAGVFPVLLDRGEHKFPAMPPCHRIYSLYELRPLLEISS